MSEMDDKQQNGRIKNVLQNYLIRQLLVPKIFLDATWNGKSVDVLGVDRAGVGDVHAIRICTEAPELQQHPAVAELKFLGASPHLERAIQEIKALEAQYTYLAIPLPGSAALQFSPLQPLIRSSYAEDGVGRVGLLFVDLRWDDPKVTVALKPERFRSKPEIIQLADAFVASHEANWEIRDEPTAAV